MREDHADNKTDYIRPTDTPILIPDAKEKARRQEAEEHQRRKDNDDLLLKLHSQQANAQTLQASSNIVIAGLTVGLVIASLSGLFVSYLQFNVARDAINVASRQASAAERANDIAEENSSFSRTQTKTLLDASIEQTRLDQRAWVGPIETIVPPIGSTDHYGVLIVNTGKTPARKVFARISTKYIPTRSTFTATYIRNVGQPSISVLQPNMRLQVMSLAYPQLINAREQAGIVSGDSTLYMYGIITYEDIFKKTRKTTFCLRMTRQMNRFEGCDTYNDAN